MSSSVHEEVGSREHPQDDVLNPLGGTPLAVQDALGNGVPTLNDH